jgi:hypothetical protein
MSRAWSKSTLMVGHEQLVSVRHAAIQPLMHTVEREIDQQYAVFSPASPGSYG